MKSHSIAFADLDRDDRSYDSARAVVLPVPYERTTCWKKGTRRGPRAILKASHHLELWDDELEIEIGSQGIATLRDLAPTDDDQSAALDEIRRGALRPMQDGKFVLALGGEHSISPPLVEAAKEVHGEIGVIQFDAHGDLRDSYEGSRYSHGCAMRRILDLELPSLAVGIRSLSTPEAQLIQDRNLEVIWGRELDDLTRESFRERLDSLPPRVYLTFDVDFFDPGFLPATGTPVPGGGHWYPTLALMRELFASKEVVAMDIVEVRPTKGLHATEFIAANLAYKCLGYSAFGEDEPRWVDGPPSSSIPPEPSRR